MSQLLLIKACDYIIGRNNTTTKIIVQDHDGINVSCGTGFVSIENLSILNDNSSCKKAIGINVTSQLQNLSVEIKDCNILNFTIGAKIKTRKSNLTIRNKIISSIEFHNIVDACQFCTHGNQTSKGKNYSVGLWFNSPLGAFEIHDNTIELKNNHKSSNLYTYGIIHDGPAYDCAYYVLDTQDTNQIKTTACKVMYLRGKNSADCTR